MSTERKQQKPVPGDRTFQKGVKRMGRSVTQNGPRAVGNAALGATQAATGAVTRTVVEAARYVRDTVAGKTRWPSEKKPQKFVVKSPPPKNR